MNTRSDWNYDEARYWIARLFDFGVTDLVREPVLQCPGHWELRGSPSRGELHWVDALLNAAMILAGMGPVNALQPTAGQLFATVYALYSGVAFLTMTGILFAPIVHRFFHRLHVDLEHGGRATS